MNDPKRTTLCPHSQAQWQQNGESMAKKRLATEKAGPLTESPPKDDTPFPRGCVTLNEGRLSYQGASNTAGRAKEQMMTVPVQRTVNYLRMSKDIQRELLRPDGN